MVSPATFHSLDNNRMISRGIGPSDYIPLGDPTNDITLTTADFVERQEGLLRTEWNILPFPPEDFTAIARHLVPQLIRVTPITGADYIDLGPNKLSHSVPKLIYEQIGNNEHWIDAAIVFPYHLNLNKPPVCMAWLPMLDDVATSFGDKHTILAVTLTTNDPVPTLDSKFLPTLELLTVHQNGLVTPRGWVKPFENDGTNDFVPSLAHDDKYLPRNLKAEGRDIIPMFDLSDVMTGLANSGPNRNDRGPKNKISCKVAVLSMGTNKNGDGGSMHLQIQTTKTGGAHLPGGAGSNPAVFTLIDDPQILVKQLWD